jgi:phosphatidate cytidylyltransferase
VVALLAITPLIVWSLAKSGAITPSHQHELNLRYYSWLVLAPLMIGPILLGAAWTIGAIGLLSLFCYREFARATGLFREKTVSLVVVLGILAVNFATFDHWYGFFVALFPLTVATVSAAAILSDRPQGYLQRVALGMLGFVWFGCAMGHLAYFANDQNYRPMLLLLVLAVELNDVFAYVSGKSFGRRKLAPNTSPNKTLGGGLGALVATTTLVALLGHLVFQGTEVDRPGRLLLLGLIVSVTGQLGDLMLSSVKRDLGLKDLSQLIPGHGGLLDRFDSLILAAPAAFHYVGYYNGIGLDQATRLITGGQP